MKQEFQHTLPTQDIVIRQDANTDTEFFETHVGQWFPLVRIKDEVVDFPNIVSFKLSCGINQFIPLVEITIDDSEMIFRESNFIEHADVITIWVGNPKDDQHKPIKNDYYVLDAYSSAGSNFVTITAMLYVPLLWASPNRIIESDSIECLRQVAKECGLGFVTNVQGSNDSMKWIQSENNFDFINHVVERSFVNESTYLQIFVDQFANLNVMDVNQAISNSAETMLTTMPISGKPLEPAVKLYASNDTRGTDEPKASIIAWTPLTSYGLASTKYVTNVVSKSIFPEDVSLDDEKVSGELNKQLQDTSKFTTFLNNNVHESYGLAKATNLNNQQLLSSTKLSATLDFLIPVIYLGMTLPVKIWNIQKHEQRRSQDANVDNDDLEEVVPTGASPDAGYQLNEKFTGDTLLLDLTIGYSRKSSKSTEDRHLRQSLTLLRK